MLGTMNLVANRVIDFANSLIHFTIKYEKIGL